MSTKLVQVNVSMREELYVKLKLLAAIKDQTLKDLVNEALEEYIKAHEAEIKQKLSEVMQ